MGDSRRGRERFMGPDVSVVVCYLGDRSRVCGVIRLVCVWSCTLKDEVGVAA